MEDLMKCYCGVKFERTGMNQKHCSYKCMRKFNKVIYYCEECLKPLDYPSNRLRARKYCFECSYIIMRKNANLNRFKNKKKGVKNGEYI